MGCHLAVHHQYEACALMIAMAVLIPDDGEYVATIADSIEAEVIPTFLRYEGIHHDAAISLGSETADTRDYQIIERGVVIIAAALTVAHQPGSIGFVEVLADVRPSAMVLTLYVEFHLTEESISQIYLLIRSF